MVADDIRKSQEGWGEKEAVQISKRKRDKQTWARCVVGTLV